MYHIRWQGNKNYTVIGDAESIVDLIHRFEMHRIYYKVGEVGALHGITSATKLFGIHSLDFNLSDNENFNR